MSTPIFNTQQLFSSGAFVSGTSATKFLGALLYDSPIAYSRGPITNVFYVNSSKIASSGSVGVITSSSVMSMDYLWRAYFLTSSQNLYLDRSTSTFNSSFSGWTNMITKTIPKLVPSGASIGQVLNIDFAMDNYGYFFVALEIPVLHLFSADDITHTSDVVLFTNSNPGLRYFIEDSDIKVFTPFSNPYDLVESYPNSDVFVTPAGIRTDAINVETFQFASNLVISTSLQSSSFGNVSIIPFFAPPTGKQGGAFTSQTGTGASLPISMSWTVNVSTVEITCFDSTYSGNSASLYDLNGNLLDRKQFSFSGIPGINTPSTVHFYATGSKRLMLSPRHGLDYVEYTVKFGVLGFSGSNVQSNKYLLNWAMQSASLDVRSSARNVPPRYPYADVSGASGVSFITGGKSPKILWDGLI